MINHQRASRAARPRPRQRTAPSRLDAHVRPLVPDDYGTIATLADAWSRGRFIGVALPRSFFQHFSNTSLVLESGGDIVGVLIGFQSPADRAVAYIHYAAVSPRCRRRGLGRLLYERFFEHMRLLGCREVQSIAPPVNSGLIAFHRQLQFEVVQAGGFANGIVVSLDYAGPGQHRVLFRRELIAGRAEGEGEALLKLARTSN